MFRTILIPTDFSECAGYATRVARAIAQRTDGKVVFFHNADIKEGWNELDEEEKERFPESQARVAEIEKELKRLCTEMEGESVSASSVFADGKFIDNLNEYVKLSEVDLIVMGSHGRSGRGDGLMGSNAQKVVRYIECPVLVVKKPIERVEFKQIIFASNFNTEARTAFLKVVELAHHFDAHIHLATVQKPSFFNVPRIIVQSSMEEFKKLAIGVNCTSHDFSDTNVQQGIKHLAEEIDADLIAIGTYGRGRLSQLFIGSAAEALVNTLEQPIMTLNLNG